MRAAHPRQLGRVLRAVQGQGQLRATRGQGLGTRRPLCVRAGQRLEMLYDGACPLCMREVNMLRRRDAQQGSISFVDVASPDYEANQHGGITFRQAMERIHVRLPDGRVVTNVAAFRHLYEAVGLGWVYWLTRHEPVRTVAEWVYNVWARYRLQLTGRDPEAVFAQKETCGPREPAPSERGSAEKSSAR